MLAASAALSGRLGREVDLVALDDAGYPLLKRLVLDGRVLKGDAAAEGQWRARALSVLELDRAWYGRMRDAFLGRLASGGS
jgi:hypothetical protein